MKKLKTDNENLLFIGYNGLEEYYLEMDGDFKGWSFMGLRPNTEEELRGFAREIEIEEYCTIPSFLNAYIDREAFSEDMENNWEERHDVQATRENKEGKTLYLGFGSGQDILGYFKTNSITDYNSFVEHFEYVGLDEKEFDQLMKTVNSVLQ